MSGQMAWRGSLIGLPTESLETPALVVDYDILLANITRLQLAATAAGLALRPHIKAHKTPAIAHLQLRAGAVGVTTAKIGEAEAMAEAGVDDIFIAHSLVGESKLRRLIALSRRVPRLSVAVENQVAAEQLNEALGEAGLQLPVMMEVDTGARRCGVLPEQARSFAHTLAGLPQLQLEGVMAYAAGAYQCRSEAERVAFTRAEGQALRAVADELTAEGFEMRRISGGASPTAGRYEADCGLTELRCGTYCLNDHNQVDLGACSRDDVAAGVLATVVSTPAADRAICDAGTKALGQQVSPITSGFGWAVAPVVAPVVQINDEHGYLGPPATELPIGSQVRLIPPRICTCLNLYDWMLITEGGRVRDVWPITARGCNS